MENPARDESYAEAKRKAKVFYKTIGRIWCPALGDYIRFNSVGFRHLIWKGAEQRPRQEQERRFALIPRAKKILAAYHGPMEFREEIEMSTVKKYGRKIRKFSRAKFWGITAKRGDKTITIVIRQIDHGNKHFFSIF